MAKSYPEFMRGKKIIFFISITVFVQLISLFILHPRIIVWEDHYMALNKLQTGEAFCVSDGQNNHSFVFPVYYSVVFLLYKIFGLHPIIVMAFHILLNGVTAFFTWKTADFFFDKFFADHRIYHWKEKLILIPAGVVLFHPLILWYSFANVHPLVLDMFFFYACLFFTTVFFRNATIKNLLLFAITFGLSILDRPTLIVCILPFLLLSFENFRMKKILLNFSLVLFVSMLIIMPLLIRNYRTDKIIGLNSATGKILWKGALYNSEGGNYLDNGKSFYAAMTGKDFDTLDHLSVREQNKFFMNKYLIILKNDPAHVTAMYFVKLKNFWWFRKNIGNEYPAFCRELIPLYKIVFGLILLLFIICCILSGRRIFFLISAPVGLSLFQSVFYVETRHRLIIEPLLVFLAVAGLFLLIDKLKILNKKN
ncbi:MAG: hypothetical protein HY064_11800 [Bacteroidetes bacterium]|nr:hypothetical protein [Bacteroidota bacterium]